jgi:Condensation domain
VTEIITFEHKGGRTGDAALTWGQQAIWGALADLGPDHHQFNNLWDFPSGDGWSIDQVRTALGHLFSTYESLKTRFVQAGGEVRQVLGDTAELEVEIDDVGSPDDEHAAVSALRERLFAPPFDYANDTPMRVGAVRRDGLIRWIVLSVSHLAADGESMRILAEDFAAYADGAVPQELLADRSIAQPLEIAAYQAGPDGARDNTKSLKFWQQKLSTLPTSMIGGGFAGGDPREPRFWQGRISSRRLLLAADFLADRYQVSSTNVALAAGAEALTRLFGTKHCLLQIIANNRIAQVYRHAVSTISIEGLFALETGVAFPELVQRTRKASMSAYRHANYDKRRLLDLVGSIEAERGARIDRSCWFNDARVAPSSADLPAPGDLAAELSGGESRARVTWPATFERQGDTTFSLHLIKVPDVLEFAFTADTHVIGPAGIEQVLLDIQDVLLDEAVREARRPAEDHDRPAGPQVGPDHPGAAR